MTGIWAHRGASGLAPENTLPAFELALQLDADGIELDVQRSADGQLVVCHDETVDRTTDGHGAIVDLPWDRLRGLDASAGMAGFAGVRIPLLAEVFELFRGTGRTINVELKDSEEPYPGMGAGVVRLAASMGVADQVIYSSFNHFSLRDLLAQHPALPVGLLYGEPLVGMAEYARAFGARAIHPYHRALLGNDTVERCHDAGIAVHAWTTNSDDEIASTAALGVDALITNHPDRARDLLGAPAH